MSIRTQNGLSLLEVLVAFAILAVSLTALLRVFGTGLRNANLAEANSQAALRAESVLAATAMEPSLSPGEKEGDYGDGFWWRRTVRPFPMKNISGDPLGMAVIPMEVIAEVSWRTGDRRRFVRLASLRLSKRDKNLTSPGAQTPR